MGCIYVHINTLNNKVYVGQTWLTLRRRKLNTYRSSTHFNRAILKYSWDNFETQILAEEDTQEKLDTLEKVLKISKSLLGNKRHLGYKHSEETKCRIKEAIHKSKSRNV